MIYVVIAFLWVSLLLYLLLGGADFGAGIIELFTSDRNRKQTRQTMYRAIGPIWEANHMWLIIAVVILFVGFPEIYSLMSTYLHIPLLVMLLGIIARGTAFTFRHYDAVVDDMQIVYNKIFVYSSFITPLFLGIIAGSAVSSRINPDATSFPDAYVWNWLNLFAISVGLFTVAICGFLAAIFLIGEANDEQDRLRFVKKSKMMSIAAFICGALVFGAGYMENIPLFAWTFGNTYSLLAVIAATISFIMLWARFKAWSNTMLRLLAGFQISMILFAATFDHFPYIVLLKNGHHLSLLEKGQESAINMLGTALLLGSIFILPALFYLLYSFKKKSSISESH